MNQYKAIIPILVVLCMPHAIAATLNRFDSIATSELLTMDEIAELRAPTETRSIDKAVERWKQSPVHQRLALLDALLVYARCDSHLVDASAVKRTDAVHAISMLVGKDIAVDSDANSNSFELAAREVEVFREKVLELHRKKAPKKSLQELKRLYHNRISTQMSATVSPKSIEIMESLLAEWFPIGKSASELESILGVLGDKTESTIAYRFDSGFGGMEYCFLTKDGLIVNVFRRGIN